MFGDAKHFHEMTVQFTQLRGFKGAQEYEDGFKKKFGFNIDKKIKANRVERYNPKNDFTLQAPGSYTDEVLSCCYNRFLKYESISVFAVWRALLRWQGRRPFVLSARASLCKQRYHLCFELDTQGKTSVATHVALLSLLCSSSQILHAVPSRDDPFR